MVINFYTWFYDCIVYPTGDFLDDLIHNSWIFIGKWLGIILLAIFGVFILLVQVHLYSYYYIFQLRYKYSIESFTFNCEEEMIWCKENGIKCYNFYPFDDLLLLWDVKITEKNEYLRVRYKEDAMAFKLGYN